MFSENVKELGSYDFNPKEEIKRLLSESRKLIDEATKIANEYGEGFSWNLAYGMGGYYYPQKMSKKEALKLLENGEYEKSSEKIKEKIRIALKENDEYYESGWKSSSSNC